MDLLSSLNALSSSLQNASNIALTAHVKKRDRKFMKEMYEKQLADNRENWQMQNEYNAPSAQMERLQSAGLNPNLIYGSGAVGNSASVPSSATTGTGGYSSVPKLEQFNMLGQYMQLRMMREDLRSKQLDNEIKAESAKYAPLTAESTYDLLTARLNLVRAEGDIKSFQSQIKYDEYLLHQYVNYGYEELTEKPENLDDATWYRMERLADSGFGDAYRAQLHRPGMSNELLNHQISMVAEQLKLMPEKLKIMRSEAVIKDFHAKLAAMGINPSDAFWLRVIGILAGQFGGSIWSKVAGGLNDFLDILDSVNYE